MKKFFGYVSGLIAILALSSGLHAQTITTVAGSGIEGYAGDGGKATAAKIHWPQAIALDKKENIYIADADNNVIRRIDAVTGIVTTVAGNGYLCGTGSGDYSGDNGPATVAHLNQPTGVAIDTAGNIFIADSKNHCVRKVNKAGVITTVAGTGVPGFSGDNSPATGSRLNQPTRVAVDTFGNIFITDVQNHRIRKVDASANIFTVAGTGLPGYSGDGAGASAAQLFYPIDVAVDKRGNLYIADELNNCIRKVDMISGIITTIAGNSTVPAFTGDGGPATDARLYDPTGIAVDTFGNVYISDMGNFRVRVIDTVTGIIHTIAGTDSAGYNGDKRPATTARLSLPQGLALNPKGSLFIADQGNDRIRFIGSKIEGIQQVINYISEVSVYPNPGADVFEINIASVISEPAKVKITDIKGSLVMQTDAYTNKARQITLSAPPGIYLMSVQTPHGTWNGKLVVR